MPATFVVVPQWQGSGSSRALRLVDGANAIRGDLPAAATRYVEVPEGAGEAQDSGVHRLTTLQSVASAQSAVLRTTTGTVITIGGDCGVELTAIDFAVSQPRSPAPSPETGTSDQASLSDASDLNRVAVVWIDAHGDLNTPESSPSGAFHGMVLRTLLGDGPVQLTPHNRITPQRVFLAGTRSLDEAEADYLAASGIAHFPPARLADPAELVAAIAASGAESVYLHIDLDVLDPTEINSVGFPEPFGVSLPDLLALITRLRAAFSLAGAGIVEFAPANQAEIDGDLPTILRIIGALTR